MVLQSTKNILQIWLYIACKQTHENEKIFYFKTNRVFNYT